MQAYDIIAVGAGLFVTVASILLYLAVREVKVLDQKIAFQRLAEMEQASATKELKGAAGRKPKRSGVVRNRADASTSAKSRAIRVAK